MNGMEPKILVGTKKMCMSHEPAGFWPNIFLNIFLGGLKIHYPVSRMGRPGPNNEEKVNCSSLKFVATSREHTLPENARLGRKQPSKSVKNALF